MTNRYARIDRTSDAFWLEPLFFWTSIVWNAAMPMIHGTSDEFSTGSQAQYPPNERVTYAQ